MGIKIDCKSIQENILEITRNNKLLVYSKDVGYWSWFTDACAEEALDFINQE